MPKNTLKVSREQLGILKHLDNQSVRYVAVGDFAMLAIDPARMLQQAQLWIEPARQNLQRFNQALKSMFGPRTTRQVDTNAEANEVKTGRLLSLGVGPFRVGIYFGVGGFKPGDFNQVYDRSQLEKAAVPGQQEGGTAIRRLNNADLTHQLRTEAATHVGWNLQTIHNADQQVVTKKLVTLKMHDEHKGQNVLYDLSAKSGRDVDEKTTGHSSDSIDGERHKGHFVPYAPKAEPDRLPMTRDVDEIQRKMSVEAVLGHYGFKPETTHKPDEPWRIYERNVAGNQQRIVVGTLKETRRQHFYEVGNRAFQGDVLDLVSGLERPLITGSETVAQRTFRMVDDWLSQPDRKQVNDIPGLRPISNAYFFGVGATLGEQAINEHYGLTPLTKTDALEALSLSKATLYAPEFDGRILNADAKSSAAIAFPLVDRAGKLVEVAMANSDRSEAFVRQPETADALWQSNRFYRTITNVPVAGGETIPTGTIGVVNRQDAQKLAFHYQQEGQDRKVLLPVQESKFLLAEQSANRLVVGQSPVDVLAVKQLNPEATGERRLYMATNGTPTPEQTARVEQLLSKNPQAQVVLATNRDMEGYRTAINYLGTLHPAADPGLRVKPELTQLPVDSTRQSSDQQVGTFFYPREPALRSSDDVLKRFGYYAYGKPSTKIGQGGVDPKHVERLLDGKQGVTTGTDSASTYSDNLTLKALTSALTYAQLHNIPLSDQLKVVRDTPALTALLQKEKQHMQKVYGEEYGGTNQLTIELRQPTNGPSATTQNDQFLHRFISTLTLTANQMQAQTHPQRTLDVALRPAPPVQELSRQTFVDPKNGQTVTRSNIILSNDERTLDKATHLLANEINERQGQRLIQIVQPGLHHKTMTDTLTARNGHPLPQTHRASLGQPESIKPHMNRPTGTNLNLVTPITDRLPVDRVAPPTQAAERVRPVVKVG